MIEHATELTQGEQDGRLGVESVERALTILSAFSDGDTTVSLKDIAERTAMSKATILRICASLERFGYLSRDQHGLFRLGPTLWRLGSLFRQNLDLYAIVQPTLRGLVALTQESASFWIKRGPERICLYRVNSPRIARSHVDEGETCPLDRGSPGHVISHFSGEPTRLSGDITADGVLATLGDRDPDVASVSAPVFGSDGQLVGALTLAGILNRFVEHVPTYKILVRQAAITLSDQLGGPVDRNATAR